ncbi:protein quiver-like [Tigriopus californicus]|uniref:protein quiver-like n=1 Tax=Tigriopus californicus TaxID=6832 RepID=UPI0027DA59B6|nr:protein quiver-like [Tigriopus californicus]
MEREAPLSEPELQPDEQGDRVTFCPLIADKKSHRWTKEGSYSSIGSDTDVKFPEETVVVGRSLSSTFILQCLLIFALFAFGYVQAVAECMSGNNLKCFECNSHTDPHCGDPFNWTTLPPRKPCDGCCVKMVQGIGTPSMSVLRTCTSELSINYFMVDHVCMSQSNRRGQLCFCEDDLCNQAQKHQATPHSSALTLMSYLACMTTLSRQHFNSGYTP